MVISNILLGCFGSTVRLPKCQPEFHHWITIISSKAGVTMEHNFEFRDEVKVEVYFSP